MKNLLSLLTVIVFTCGVNAQLKIPKTSDVTKTIGKDKKSQVTPKQNQPSETSSSENPANTKADTTGPGSKTKPSTTRPVKSPASTGNDASDKEYQELYDKLKPLFEIANLINKTSGQTISDINYFHSYIANVPAEEISSYPAKIASMAETNKRAKNLQFQYGLYEKEFKTTNPIIKQMMTTLKQEYSYYGKPEFTAQRMDAFREGMTQAITLFTLLNKSFAENNDYKSFLSQTESMRQTVEKKLGEKYAANHTSAFHAANAHKILLSDKTITVGKETTAQFKKSFKAGESIKGVLYLNEQIKTYNKDYEYVALELFFDEAIDNNLNNHSGCLGTSYKTIQLTEKETSNTTITFDLIPDDIKSNHIPAVYVKKITECLSNLLPGKHTVRLQIGLLPGGMTTAWNKSITFITDFELDVTEEGLKLLAEKVQKLEAAELAAVRMGKPGMNDAAMLQLVKKAADKNGHIPQKMVIVSDNWSTGFSEDALGRKVPRYKRLYCEYAFKDTDGKCYIQSVDIFREYTGNGTYGSAYTEAGKDFRKQILCENINK